MAGVPAGLQLLRMSIQSWVSDDLLDRFIVLDDKMWPVLYIY